jgi:hypothetical protein
MRRVGLSTFTVGSKSFPKGWWVETTTEIMANDWEEWTVWRVGLYKNGVLMLYRDVNNLSKVEPLVADLQALIAGKEHG